MLAIYYSGIDDPAKDNLPRDLELGYERFFRA